MHLSSICGAREELKNLLRELPARRLRQLCATMKERALEAGLWSEEQGQRKAVGLAALPLLLDGHQWTRLQQSAWQVRLGLRRLPAILRESPEARRLLCLDESELEWLSSCASPTGERVFCRLDALLPEDGPRFIETNIVGIGGMTYAPAAGQAVFATLCDFFPEPMRRLGLRPPQDPRLLLLAELRTQALTLGLPEPLSIGLIDDSRLYRLGGEMGRLRRFLAGHGVTAYTVDPREISCDATGRPHHRGRPVDLFYRFLEVRELAEIEAVDGPLTGLRSAFCQGRVVPSVAGDLDQKATFELLTNPDYGSWFSRPQRQLFAARIPWTRLLREGPTTGPEGERIDLLPFALKHRAELVLKPNRGYGGEGVLLGAETDQRLWETRVGAALTGTDSYVLQSYVEPISDQIPVLGEETLDWQKRYLTAGLFPTQQQLGALGRYSGGAVVNICQQGGVVPFLLC